MAVFYIIGSSGIGFAPQVIVHFIGLVLAPLLFMYLSSHVFRFCSYHRLFIYYVGAMELLNVVDWYTFMPLNNSITGTIHTIINWLLFIGIGIHFILKRKVY